VLSQAPPRRQLDAAQPVTSVSLPRHPHKNRRARSGQAGLHKRTRTAARWKEFRRAARGTPNCWSLPCVPGNAANPSCQVAAVRAIARGTCFASRRRERRNCCACSARRETDTAERGTAQSDGDRAQLRRFVTFHHRSPTRSFVEG
jgi:hypothetical protein